MSSETVPAVRAGWLLGSARQLQRDQLGAYLRAMSSYGELARFRVGPPRVGFTFDAVFTPEGAKQVLATPGSRYVKDAPVYREFAHLFGGGLAVREGEPWRSRRRLLQPLFTPQHVSASVPQVTRASSELMAQLADAPGQEVDLTEIGLRYAVQALGRTVFGGDGIDRAVPVLREALPVLSEHATRRGLAPVRLSRRLPTSANRRAERTRAALYALVDDLISRRRSDAGGGDLVSRLLAARDPETGAGLDARQIRDEVLIFLVAGFETTATALALTLHLLGRHPDVQERVREEVGSVLGERAPEVDDLDALVYTTQVLQEELRLYPSLHTIVRRTLDGAQLLGRPLPAGQVVAVSVWGIHRNPAVWPDPERFDPERFAPAAAAGMDRFAHLPFGAGPRSCIGRHLALAELLVAVAVLVRAYRLRAPDEEPAITAGLTLRPVGALRCRLEPLGHR